MARHISRKELKTDKFAETLTHGAEAVAAHQKLTWIVAGAAVGVLAAVGGWRYYSQSRTAHANAELQSAMRIFDARIRAAGEPSAPDEVTYVDEKNKFTDAAKSFAGVVARYGGTQPGRVAVYYEGLSLAQLGKNDEAEKQLKAVEDTEDPTLAPLAEFQLAEIYEKTNRADQALKIYRQLADKPAEFVPRALVLLKMAGLESKSNSQEAAKLYNQVKSEFPDTPAAQAADQGLQLLPPTKG